MVKAPPSALTPENWGGDHGQGLGGRGGGRSVSEAANGDLGHADDQQHAGCGRQRALQEGDAAKALLPTVGSVRCGGGLAGHGGNSLGCSRWPASLRRRHTPVFAARHVRDVDQNEFTTI
jgi:hypothetical protein